MIRVARNPGARHFGRGGTLAEGWRTPGKPVAHDVFGLAKGGEGLGALWRQGGSLHSLQAPEITPASFRKNIHYINMLAIVVRRDGLRLIAVASNGRVLRTLAVARPSRPPGLGASGRAALSQPCGPLHRKTLPRLP